MRKNIIYRMNDYKPDPAEEFRKIYDWLHKSEYQLDDGTTISAYEELRRSFIKFPHALRGTFLTIEEMEEKCGYDFSSKYSGEITIDDLVDLCEYVSTLLLGYANSEGKGLMNMRTTVIRDYMTYDIHILKVMKDNGYSLPLRTLEDISNSGLLPVCFIPTGDNEQSDIYTKQLPDDLKSLLAEYKHLTYSGGNIKEKKAILREIASIMEGKRELIKKVPEAKWLEDSLFNLFNNLNIRHNNTDENMEKYYNPVTKSMVDDGTIETWYDKIPHMCMLTSLLLEHEPHKVEIEELKKKLGQK